VPLAFWSQRISFANSALGDFALFSIIEFLATTLTHENMGHIGWEPTINRSPTDNVIGAHEADHEGFSRNPSRERWPLTIRRVVQFPPRTP
jgi:hypothetical protein